MNDAEMLLVNRVARETGNLASAPSSSYLVESLYTLISKTGDAETLVSNLTDLSKQQRSQVLVFALAAKLYKAFHGVLLRDTALAALLEIYIGGYFAFAAPYLHDVLLHDCNREATLKIFKKGYLYMAFHQKGNIYFTKILVVFCRRSWDDFKACTTSFYDLLEFGARRSDIATISQIASLVSTSQEHCKQIIGMMKALHVSKLMANRRHVLALAPLMFECALMTRKLDLPERQLEILQQLGVQILPYVCRLFCGMCFEYDLFAVEYQYDVPVANVAFTNILQSILPPASATEGYLREMYSCRYEMYDFRYTWLLTRKMSYDYARQVYFDVLPNCVYGVHAKQLSVEQSYFVAQFCACNAGAFAGKSSLLAACMFYLTDGLFLKRKSLLRTFRLNLRYFVSCIVYKPYNEFLLRLMCVAPDGTQTDKLYLNDHDLYKYFEEVRGWLLIERAIADSVLDVYFGYLLLTLVNQRWSILDIVLKDVCFLLSRNVILQRNYFFEFTLIVIFLLRDADGRRRCVVQRVVLMYNSLLVQYQISIAKEYLEHFSSQKDLIGYLECRDNANLNAFAGSYLKKCAAIDSGTANIYVITLFLSTVQMDETYLEYFSNVIEKYLNTDLYFGIFDIFFPDWDLEGLIQREDRAKNARTMKKAISSAASEVASSSAAVDHWTNYDSNLMRICRFLAMRRRVSLLQLLQDTRVASYAVLTSQASVPTLIYLACGVKVEAGRVIEAFVKIDAVLLLFCGLVSAVRQKSGTLALLYALPFFRCLNLLYGTPELGESARSSYFALWAANLRGVGGAIASAATMPTARRPMSTPMTPNSVDLAGSLTGFEDQLQLPFSQILRYCYSKEFVDFVAELRPVACQSEVFVAAELAKTLFLRNWFTFNAREALCGGLDAVEIFARLHALNRRGSLDVAAFERAIGYYSANGKAASSRICRGIVSDVVQRTEKPEDMARLLHCIAKMDGTTAKTLCAAALAQKQHMALNDCNLRLDERTLLNNNGTRVFCVSRLDFYYFEPLFAEYPQVNTEYVKYVEFEARLRLSHIYYFNENSQLASEYFYTSALILLASFFATNSYIRESIRTRIERLMSCIYMSDSATSDEETAILHLPGMLHLVRIMVDLGLPLTVQFLYQYIDWYQMLLPRFNQRFFDLSDKVLLYLPFVPARKASQSTQNALNRAVFDTVFITYQLLTDQLQIIDFLGSQELFLYFTQEYLGYQKFYRQLTYFVVQIYSWNYNFAYRSKSDYLQLFERYSAIADQLHSAYSAAGRADFEINYFFIYSTTCSLQWLEDFVVYLASVDLLIVVETLFSFIDNRQLLRTTKGYTVQQNYEYILGYIARILLGRICQNCYEQAVAQGQLFDCMCAAMKEGVFVDIAEGQLDEFTDQTRSLATFIDEAQCVGFYQGRYIIVSQMLGMQIQDFQELMEAISSKFEPHHLTEGCRQLLLLYCRYSVVPYLETPWMAADCLLGSLQQGDEAQMTYSIPSVLQPIQQCSLRNKLLALHACSYLLTDLIHKQYSLPRETLELVVELNFGCYILEWRLSYQGIGEIRRIVRLVTYQLVYLAVSQNYPAIDRILALLTVLMRYEDQIQYCAVIARVLFEFLDSQRDREYIEKLLKVLCCRDFATVLYLIDHLYSAATSEDVKQFFSECGIRHQNNIFESQTLQTKMRSQELSVTGWMNRVVVANSKNQKICAWRLAEYCDYCLDRIFEQEHAQDYRCWLKQRVQALPNMVLLMQYPFGELEVKALGVVLAIHCYFSGGQQFFDLALVARTLSKRSMAGANNVELFVSKLLCQLYTENDLLEGCLYDVPLLFALFYLAPERRLLECLFGLLRFEQLEIAAALALSQALHSAQRECAVAVAYDMGWIPREASDGCVRRLFIYLFEELGVNSSAPARGPSSGQDPDSLYAGILK